MGVIGVGHLGRRHAEAIAGLDGVSLVGVYDIRSDVAGEVAEALGCRAFPGRDELLAAVDAASVVVPTDRHHETALAALDAGVHVLIEKPIAREVEEADEIVERAGERGLVVQVGHVERFNPAFSRIREHVDRPLFIEAHRLAPFVDRGTEVDVILDLMIHDIDLVLTVMGREVVDIWSVGVPVVTSSVDIANARITFAGHRVASLTASRISRRKMRKMRIFQRDTYISIDLLNRRSELYRIERGMGRPGLREHVFEEEGDANPLAEEIRTFAESVRDGLRPRVSGDDARSALELAHRVRERMFVPPDGGEG
jgi:predicted dehydrogenase